MHKLWTLPASFCCDPRIPDASVCLDLKDLGLPGPSLGHLLCSLRCYSLPIAPIIHTFPASESHTKVYTFLVLWTLAPSTTGSLGSRGTIR